MHANDKLKKWINHNYLTKGDRRMITDKTKWDDADYYEENFEDIMFDKLSSHNPLANGDLAKLVNTGKLTVDQKTVYSHDFYSKIRTIVCLRYKYYAIEYWNCNDRSNWYYKQPYEVKEHTITVTEWIPVKQDS